MANSSQWNMSIRWLLMATYIVAAVIFGGLITIAISHVVNAELREKLISDAEEIAERLAADSTLALALRSEARAEEAAIAALSLTHVQYVAIFRSDNKTFYERGPLVHDARGIDQPDGKLLRICAETPTAIYVDAPVTLKSDLGGILKRELLGYVRLGMSKQGYIQVERDLRRGLWLIMLGLGALVLVSLWAVTQRVTAPLNKLAGTIREAEETGELSEAAVEGTTDVRQIATAYNSLVQELKQDRASLEIRVEERTRELRAAKEETEKLIEENRRLIQSMNRLSEGERLYVSREIHDQLNATLVAARLGLKRVQKALERMGEGNPEVRELQTRIIELGTMVEEGYTIGRRIIHRLRPEIIDALGLQGAMEEMIGSYNRLHSSCEFVLRIEGELTSINDEIGMAIYRIAQEAFTNTVKHAQATRVQVVLRRLRRQGLDVITLTIKDNGVGFNTSQRSDGIGILSMRERVRGLSGEFDIQSSGGNGTRLNVVLPAAVDGRGSP